MKKIGVLGLMAALAVTGAVAFLPKGVMAAEDSDQTISQGVYIGDVDVSGMTQEEAKKAVEDGMSEAKAANITLKVVHPLYLQTLCSLLRLPASDYILALAYIHTLLPTMEHQIRSATYQPQLLFSAGCRYL